MTDWSVGSVANHCYNSVDNVPTNVSGVINDLVLNSIYLVQNWTQQTINQTIIPDTFKPAVIAFTMAELNLRLQIANGGVSDASIEGLRAVKNYKDQAEMWTKIGNEHLKRLGKAGGYYKVFEG